eukprot:m.17811 g.17811  ORF g.17811 m.17811 type:complete len:77 (+) comp7582_c0_seq1:1008-1238(+)
MVDIKMLRSNLVTTHQATSYSGVLMSHSCVVLDGASRHKPVYRQTELYQYRYYVCKTNTKTQTQPMAGSVISQGVT